VDTTILAVHITGMVLIVEEARSAIAAMEVQESTDARVALALVVTEASEVAPETAAVAEAAASADATASVEATAVAVSATTAAVAAVVAVSEVAAAAVASEVEVAHAVTAGAVMVASEAVHTEVDIPAVTAVMADTDKNR
jgi:hypothetical protein